MAAMEQRKRIEEAIRKETQENGYEMPFNPQLYRLALEMATPYGWDGIDKAKFSMIADASKAERAEYNLESSEEGGLSIDNSASSDYNENQENVNSYRLRFMSNRDTAFRNMEAVEYMAGYQDVAVHADAYGFAAQDPETEELLLDISAKELAYRIIDSGKYNGGPIRLLACSAGAAEDGAAQQLADLLKVPVLAPTDTLFTSMDGYMAVATKESEAIEMMSQMQKQNKKSSMEGWKLYEPR